VDSYEVRWGAEDEVGLILEVLVESGEEAGDSEEMSLVFGVGCDGVRVVVVVELMCGDVYGVCGLTKEEKNCAGRAKKRRSSGE
jgi:hypothetical protein